MTGTCFAMWLIVMMLCPITYFHANGMKLSIKLRERNPGQKVILSIAEVNIFYLDGSETVSLFGDGAGRAPIANISGGTKLSVHVPYRDQVNLPRATFSATVSMSSAMSLDNDIVDGVGAGYTAQSRNAVYCLDGDIDTFCATDCVAYTPDYRRYGQACTLTDPLVTFTLDFGANLDVAWFAR
jgi:hypothetical protein